MASSLEFVQYVAQQLDEAGAIRYKSMFGEYGLYCDEKYFAVVCDNRFLVKITEAGKQVMPEHVTDIPYKGAKPMFLVENLEDKDFMTKLAIATCSQLPVKKAKVKK